MVLKCKEITRVKLGNNHTMFLNFFFKKLDKASEKDFTGHGTEMDGRTLVSQKAASIFITDLLTLKGSG